MSTAIPQYAPEPEWDEVFADPAVKRLTRYVPPNSADYHDEASDARIRENMEKQSAWLHRIFKAAIAEDE